MEAHETTSEWKTISEEKTSEEVEMKLSIIMPAYNVEDTVCRALDSIVSQVVSFEYEIVIVNDASTDKTSEILDEYKSNYSQIRVVNHRENKGNACSFFDGLSAARGELFCVLDGDDYYTVPDKLQRQVSFFESDTKHEYVACAHHFVYDLGECRVSIPRRSGIDEGTFLSWLDGSFGYYHTATYMFRNVFLGNPPAELRETINRGDTARAYILLKYSSGKIKVLDFFGSAYVFSYDGIWSSMTTKEQWQYQIRYQEHCREVASSSFEKETAETKLMNYSIMDVDDERHRMEAISIDDALLKIREYQKQFAFGASDYVFQGIFSSSYFDSLCASLGSVFRSHNQALIQTSSNENVVALVNGVLSPHGGGIFQELLDLSEIFSDKKVVLFVTDMLSPSANLLEGVTLPANIEIVLPKKECSSRLEFFSKKMKEYSPSISYYYASHTDVYAAALMTKGVCQNGLLFSFDHGSVCGLQNPNIDAVVAKRGSDYEMLTRCLNLRTIYIPAWTNSEIKSGVAPYRPFLDHSNIITASGAARYYKVEGCTPDDYLDIILNSLVETGGRHYHFGPMPEYAKKRVDSYLSDAGLSPDSFVNIEWAESIPRELINNHVDVFIEPFPIVSYKMTLEIMSYGIPVITRVAQRRMETADFVYPDHCSWLNKQDLISTLGSLSAKDLEQQSAAARRYYDSFHSATAVAPFLRTLTSMNPPAPAPSLVSDALVSDIMDYRQLFSLDHKHMVDIDVMRGFSPGRFDGTSIGFNSSVDGVKGQKLSQKELVALRKENDLIKKSTSFRLGKAITGPIRKVRNALR